MSFTWSGATWTKKAYAIQAAKMAARQDGRATGVEVYYESTPYYQLTQNPAFFGACVFVAEVR